MAWGVKKKKSKTCVNFNLWGNLMQLLDRHVHLHLLLHYFDIFTALWGMYSFFVLHIDLLQYYLSSFVNIIFAYMDVLDKKKVFWDYEYKKKLCNIEYPYLAWLYSFYDRFMIDFFPQYHQYVVYMTIYSTYVYVMLLCITLMHSIAHYLKF